MIKKNFISILITNYNKERFLKKNLLSVVNQNFKNYEIILFDDHSTDSSLNIIKKFKKFKRIKLFRNLKINNKKSPPINQIKGIIKAFKQSKGDVICLLDSDDTFKKNKLKIISSFFKKNLNKEFVVNFPNTKNSFHLKKINPDQSIWPTIFPTSCISFRRNFFENYLKYINKNKFYNLEIDARLLIYAYHYCEDVNIISDKLTEYTKDEKGISSRYGKYSLNWWLKRHEAFEYLLFILKKKKKFFIFTFDYYLTKFVNFLIRTTIR